MSEVHHLQDLMVRDAGVHEARGDMDSKAESRKSASSFEATGDVIGQGDLLTRNPKDHLTRLDHYKTPVLHMDASGDVLEPGVILDVVDLGPLLEYSEVVPEREVDGPGSDLRPIERFDPDNPFFNAFSISAPIRILMSAKPLSFKSF